MGKISPLSLSWLRAYLAEGEPTFLNATASAVVAGYRAKRRHTFRQIGHLNRIRLERRIAKWLDEAGMNEVQLKTKFLQLMEARETKFEKIKGAVLQSSLPEGCRVIAISGTVVSTKDGKVYGDGDTLLAIDVAALETQRKALDMALKMQGLYAAEKHEHSGAIATVTELTEKDRQLARDLVYVGIQKLMEAEQRHPPNAPPRLLPRGDAGCIGGCCSNAKVCLGSKSGKER